MPLFMVIEHYVHGARVVYERFAAQGRMLPDGVSFIDSWIVDEPEPRTCYQLMRAPDREALDLWISRWSDVMDVECFPVIDSATAQSRRSPASAGDA
ncbi:DUF3303 domain-containing protein [Microbacterium sp. No. 7]|uniref:DUF3303 domain-containing protein n=1 Tax=Microbacterium sp. No. 7 TaxID=1714373 RepID=UPI0006D1641C|nr:DUF3303 family protein [Microbacterium sp. No. 7]ALJ18617.1 hypothetical protein AOA12_01285 [Microbacterium sp. No. 7]